MKKKKILTKIFCFIIMISLLGFPSKMLATEKSEVELKQYHNAEVDFLNQFTYVVGQPKNQKENVANQLELLMEADQEQTISVSLINKTDKILVLKPNIRQASTSSEGTLVYLPTEDSDLVESPYVLSDMFEFPDTVEVPAGGSAELRIKIKMPKDKFDGKLLYGITIADQMGEYEQLISPLSLYETDVEVKPNLTLEKAIYRADKKMLEIDLKNDSLVIMENLQVKYQVKQDSDNSVKGQLNNIMIAPLSVYRASINVDSLNASNNNLLLTVNGSQISKEWQQKSVEVEGKKPNWLKNTLDSMRDSLGEYSLLALIFILLMVIIWIGASTWSYYLNRYTKKSTDDDDDDVTRTGRRIKK